MKPFGIQLKLFKQNWAALQHFCHPGTLASQWVPWGSFKRDTRTKSAACTHIRRRIGAPSGCDCPMGVPKRLQMRDTCTKSAGVGNHRRVTGGSVGAPRIPEMRGTHQVRSLRTKTSGAWSALSGHGLLHECSRKPKMRYMQQVRSLRIKTSGHGWVNERFEEVQNEIHAPSPQPAHKSKGSQLGQWMRPGRQKRD